MWAIVGLGAIAALGFILSPLPLETPEGYHLANPTAIRSAPWLGDLLLTVGGFGSLIAAIASLVALIVRFRRSSGDERQQIRWLAYVGLIGLVVMVATFASDPFETINNVLFFLFFLILAVGIPAATGIAILKNRLYEIDLVIRKTLVFGTLATIITAIYVAIVVVIGTTTTESLGAVADRDGDRGRALPTDPATRRAPRRPPRLRSSRRAVRGARPLQRACGRLVRRRRRDPTNRARDRRGGRRDPRRDLAPDR